jgi:hypothetical protein
MRAGASALSEGGSSPGRRFSEVLQQESPKIIEWSHHEPRSWPEVTRLVATTYVKFPPSLRNAEDLRAERGIDIGTKLSAFGGIGLAGPRGCQLLLRKKGM